jgi:hypothetical protein
MKKFKIVFVLISIFIPTTFAFAVSGSEVNITSNGQVTVSRAKVTQIAGSTIFTKLYWGESYVRFMVKTNAKTKFLRGTGEVTTISEMQNGDYLDLIGQLESGSESMVLNATSVKNGSVQKQQDNFTGKVVSVNASVQSFVLNTTKLGVITVNTNSNTVFKKGNRNLDLDHIKVGDTITKAVGDYDLTSKVLTASSVVTYVDLNMYKPKNYEGVLKEVLGTTLPTLVRVSIAGTVYDVNLDAKSSVLSKNKNKALLNRFVPGDTVRLYGAIEEIDTPVINAEIIRNLNL